MGPAWPQASQSMTAQIIAKNPPLLGHHHQVDCAETHGAFIRIGAGMKCSRPCLVPADARCSLQAMEKLKLDTETPAPGTRPKALGMVSCVGTEYVAFKSPLPLQNKVMCIAHNKHMNVLRSTEVETQARASKASLQLLPWPIFTYMPVPLRPAIRTTIHLPPPPPREHLNCADEGHLQTPSDACSCADRWSSTSQTSSTRCVGSCGKSQTVVSKLTQPRRVMSGSLTGPARSSWWSTRSTGAWRWRRPSRSWRRARKMPCR